MNDLRNRLEDLASDATAGTQLQHPRFAVPRRSLWTWIGGMLAAVLAVVAASVGGGLVLNTGDSTAVRTIDAPVPTTAPPVAPVETTEPPVAPPDAPPSSAGPTATTSPPAATPVVPPAPVPSPGPADQGAVPEDRSDGSTVVIRYGELGPDTAIAPNDGTDGTAGSGCTPGGDARLPDGIWMVDVVAFGSDALTVDLICFKTVTSDPDAEPFEDFKIENASPTTRTMPLAGGARFFLQTRPPVRLVPDDTELRSFDEVTAAARFAEEAGDPTPLGWLVVEGGAVTELYSPPLASA